jgi:hypothetical protein
MKRKILLATIIACGFLSAKAQITKGTISLGGNLGFNSNTSKQEINGITYKNTANSFSISPSVGKAFKENVVTGINASFSYSKSNSASSTIDNYGTSLGVFIRKYAPLGKGFYIYGQGSVAAGYGTGKQYSSPGGPISTVSLKTVTTGIYIDAGLAYQASKKILVELGLGNLANAVYSHTWNKTVSGPVVPANKNSSFSINSGLSLTNLANASVGLRVLIPS